MTDQAGEVHKITYSDLSKLLEARKKTEEKARVWCPSCKHHAHPGRMCPVVTPKSYYVTPLTHPLDQDYIQCGCTYELGSVNAGRLDRGGFQTT